MDALPAIPPETVQRICAAADALYEEGGRSGPPNVDAVRRRARANMNQTSEVMRDWRLRLQAPAPVQDEQLPPGLMEAAQHLMRGVWHQASHLANTRIQEAQAGWNRDRAAQEEVRAELAHAFDRQTTELAASEQQRAELDAQLRAAIAARHQADNAARAATLQANGSAEALKVTREQIQELQQQLRYAQHHQEQLAEQLRQSHAEAQAAAARNLSEQTRYAQELGEARQDANQLRAQLAAIEALQAGGPGPASPAAPTGDGATPSTNRPSSRKGSPS